MPPIRRRLLWRVRGLCFASLAQACLVALFLGPVRYGHSQTADSFNPSASDEVEAIAVQPDGKIIVGGYFTSMGGIARKGLARLNPDGSLDRGFTAPAVSQTVLCIVVQPDFRILVGGYFSFSYGSLLRLMPDGSLDTTWRAGAHYPTCLALQPDGKVLATGDIDPFLARLETNGAEDHSFSPLANMAGTCLALQADGRVLVGGHSLKRFWPDGAVDTTFSPSFTGNVYSIVVQPDSRILVAGSFNSICQVATTNLARLNSDGTPDAEFARHGMQFGMEGNGGVKSVALQADGSILIGGFFTAIDKYFRRGIARLYRNGLVDTNFYATDGNALDGLTIQADGKILVGGYFSTIGGQSRWNIARLSNVGVAEQTLSNDGNSVTWLRVGTTPEISQCGIEVCTNGWDWVSLGTPQRIAGGWQCSGVTVPTNCTLRAHGIVSGGNGCGSVWVLSSAVGPPAFTLHPSSTTNYPGRAITLNAFAVGTDPVSFQWQKDGQALLDGGNISGAHTPLLTISNLLGQANGTYRLMATNPAGFAFSHEATVWVRDPNVTIIPPPTNLFSAGGTIRFDAWASGTQPLSLTWRHDGTNLNGFSGTVLTLTNATGAESGSYDVVVTNTFGSATSSVVQISVSDPFLLKSPTNVIVSPGQNFSLGATIFGAAPMTYFWRHEGTNLPGVFTPTLLITNAETANAGYYDLIATNVFGAVTSSVALVSLDLVHVNTNFPVFAPSAEILALAVQPDGQVLIGGSFRFSGSPARTNLMRVRPDGSIDASFAPQVGRIDHLAVLPNGKMIVSGVFTAANGEPRTNIACLLPDGTLDSTSFLTNAQSLSTNGSPQFGSLCIDRDGSVLTTAMFSSAPYTASAAFLVRFNPSGQWDPSFTVPLGAYADSAILPDRKFLIWGTITAFSNTNVNSLIRLNRDGSPDPSFNVVALDQLITAVALLPNAQILIGGYFQRVNNIPAQHMARLNSDGTLDPSFMSVPGFLVNAIALQSDGNILVCGSPAPPDPLVRRLRPDGKLDPLFCLPGTIRAQEGGALNMAIDQQGRLFIGGYFDSSAGLNLPSFACLENLGPARQSLCRSGDIISWSRGGTAPEIWCASFTASTNGIAWIDLGDAERHPGGWSISAPGLSADAQIRARGFVPYNWFVESWYPQQIPRILTYDGFFGSNSAGFSFDIGGTPGSTVVTEGSIDLVHWAPLLTNTLPVGPLPFTDQGRADFPNRFYRLSLTSPQ